MKLKSVRLSRSVVACAVNNDNFTPNVLASADMQAVAYFGEGAVVFRRRGHDITIVPIGNVVSMVPDGDGGADAPWPSPSPSAKPKGR